MTFFSFVEALLRLAEARCAEQARCASVPAEARRAGQVHAALKQIVETCAAATAAIGAIGAIGATGGGASGAARAGMKTLRERLTDRQPMAVTVRQPMAECPLVSSSDLGAASPPQVHQARTALHLATAKFGFADE